MWESRQEGREGTSFRPDGPPTQRSDDGTDYIRRPILPTRLAEWDKELVRFVRQAEERGRYDRQHDCMVSDCVPCGPAKSTVAKEG